MSRFCVREDDLLMKTKKLVITAMLLAIATVLSVIKLFELPFGGTVTPASMMPIVLIAYLYGTKWGIFSAFVYSIMQLVTGIGTVSAFFMPGDSQMALGAAVMVCVLDYFVAFTVLGFGGVFKGKFKSDIISIALGSVLACLLRALAHIVSGAVFFGSWAEWFFSDTTGLSQISFFEGFCKWVMATFTGNGLAVFYSVIYNMAYMLPEMIITALAAPAVYKILIRSKTTENL